MPQEEIIIKAFEDIGIPSAETKVYLDLRKNKESNVSEIAKRVKMHRSNVYDILTKLKQKNLVYSSSKNGAGTTFIALSSDMILHEITEKIENIKAAVSYLETAYVQGQTPKVYVLEGIGAVKNVLLNMLNKKEPIWIYGLAEKEEIMNLLNEKVMHVFHMERVKKEIQLKLLFYKYPMEEIKGLNKIKYTEARLLPKAQRTNVSQISQIVCGDMLYLTVWINPIYTIVIESDIIAREYLDFYSILWNYSTRV